MLKFGITQMPYRGDPEFNPIEHFDDYQMRATQTAVYPGGNSLGLTYTVLGLNGEAGEVAEKLKKIIRDKDGKMSKEDKLEIAKELSDVLWYLSQAARETGFNLSDIAEINIQKLTDRAQRGTLSGSGDNR